MTGSTAISERRPPSFAKKAAARLDDERQHRHGPAPDNDVPWRARPPAKRPPWLGSLLSAMLHLAVFALLLWLPPFERAGNGPAADEATITVDFIPLGEGQGQEAPQAGKHAAEAEATTGAKPTGPELAAPSDKGTEAAEAAPTSTDEAKLEPTPTEPQSPTQQRCILFRVTAARQRSRSHTRGCCAPRRSMMMRPDPPAPPA